MQRRQAETSHFFEHNIRLTATGVRLIGKMAIENLTAVEKQRIIVLTTAIQKTHADEPIPPLKRVHPARGRYFEEVIG